MVKEAMAVGKAAMAVGKAVAITPSVHVEIIEETKLSIRMLQNMVRDILVRGADYGRIPGTPADSLWDPGASQIIASFRCYVGERRILKFEDTPEKIAVCVEVPLVSRESGQPVATGIGAASTLETKYKYRWTDNPEEWGYDGDAIARLKTKTDNNKLKYRVPNLEHSELLNTIVKMASKRAEVDAAESLPGVASALRQMFSGGVPPRQQSAIKHEAEDWTAFWSQTRMAGMTQEQVHSVLGVKSMKDWIDQGRTLDEALDFIRGKREPNEPENPED